MPRPDNIGVGVAVICHNNIGQVLLGLRKNAHAAGLWSAPGGWIDPGDPSTQFTCQRELYEEVGLDFDTDMIKTMSTTIEYHEDLKITCVTCYHEVFVTQSQEAHVKLMEPHKCEQWKWFHWQSLPGNLFPNLKEQIEYYFS